VIADVQNPILGADFLRHFGLLVNLKNERLVDTRTWLNIQGILVQDSSPTPIVSHMITPNDYFAFLSEFLEFTRILNFNNQPVQHKITHHIATTGQPVMARTRRLAPERLKIARQEWEHMLELGIIRPSSSNWSQLTLRGPTSLRKHRQFLGLVNSYYRFIPNSANVLQPLNILLSKSSERSKPLPCNKAASTAF